MKVKLIGLTLALIAGTALFSIAQDSQPTQEPAARQETQRDTPARPKRLGGKRLGGIKVKAKTPVPSPVVQGPAVGGVVPRTAPVTAPTGKGGVTFEPGTQIVDFGDLIQGEVRSTTFHLESTGEDPLVIASIAKTCGCTRAEVVVLDDAGARQPYRVGAPIEPGTKILLEANIDTTGKSHAFKSDITLVTNDPRRGIVFSLKANVTPALAMNPRSLNFATMRATDTKKGQVIVTSEAYGKFKLTVDPNVPVKDVKIDLVPTKPDADGKSDRWVVKAEAGPNLPEGVLNRAVRLVSDLPQPGKALPDGTPQYFDSILFVTGNVLGPVSVNPPHLSFGLLRPGETMTRKATLAITDPDFELTAAPDWKILGYGKEFEFTDDFSVSIVPIEGTKDWEVVMTLLGMEQAGNGSFRGYVSIELGHPAKPTLEVGFSGVVRGGVTQPAGGR
jgi:hypothetical protein